MKKFLTLLLVLTLCLSLGILLTACGGKKDPPPEEEEETVTEGLKFYFNENTNEYYCSGVNPNPDTGLIDYEKIVIPSTHENLPVTKIAVGAFKNCYTVKKVVLSDSVTEILNDAFMGCTSLSTINLDKIKTIGIDSFKDCRSLKVESLPAIEDIGKNAFSGCTSLTMQDNVYYIDKHMVGVANSATAITLKEGTEKIWDDDSFATVTEITIPTSLKAIEYGVLENETLKSIRFTSLSDFVKIDRVAETRDVLIDLYENGTKIENLVLPSNVSEIKDNAFANTSIKSVTVPANIKAIGENAFQSCLDLEEFKAFGTASYGTSMFYRVELKNVYFDSFANYLNCSFTTSSNPTVSSLDAFYKINVYFNNDLVEDGEILVCPEGTKRIPVAAFMNWGKNVKVVLNSDLEIIDGYAFYESPLTSIFGGYDATSGNLSLPNTFPSTLKEIGTAAFSNASLGIGEVVIPDSVTKIGTSAFANASVGTLIVGNGVTEIPTSFLANSWVEKVVLGTGVTKIGQRAFANCDGLKEFIVLSNITEIDDELDETYTSLSVFEGTENIEKLVVPQSILKNVWKYKVTDIEITHVTKLEVGDFRTTFSNKKINLTIDLANLTEIEKDTFKDAFMFNNLYLKNFDAWVGVNLSKIEDSLLYRAYNIYVNNERVSEIRLADTVTEIKPYTLYSLNNLGTSQIKKIYIPASVQKIGEKSISSLQPIKVYIANRAEDIELDENFRQGYEADSWENEIYFDNTGVYGENEVYKWYVRGDGKLVVYSYTGDAANVEIGSIDNKEIALIKAGTFADHDEILSIKFVNKDTRVEDGAFEGCAVTSFDGFVSQAKKMNLANLASVKLSADGESAANMFKDSETLTTAVLSGFTVIDESMFEGCALLTEISGVENVTEVKANAFKDSGLEAYNFTSLSAIGNYAFNGTKLVTLAVKADAVIGDYAFFNIPTLTEISCNSESIYKFDITNVTRVVFTAGTIVTANIFKNNTKIEEVVLPSTLLEIGASAFEGCTNLTEITLPAGLTTVKAKAFKGAKLSTVMIPAGVVTVEAEAFSCNGASTFLLCVAESKPDGWNTSFGGTCMVVWGYTGVTANYNDVIYCETADSVMIVGVVDKTKETITIPQSINGKLVKHILPSVFTEEIDAVTLVVEASGDLITGYWGADHFKGLTSLKNITVSATLAEKFISKIPSTLDVWTISGSGEISSYIFNNEVEIKKIVVGDGITYIDYYAFDKIKGVVEIYIPATVEHYYAFGQNNAFEDLEKLTVPYVYSSVGSLFTKSGSIPKLSDITVLRGTVGGDTFRGTTALKKVTIGKDVSQLYAGAFVDYYLESITIDSANTKYSSDGNIVLENGVFLYSIDGTLPAGITQLSGEVGPGVVNLVIPEGVTKISGFRSSLNIESVTLPSTITEINSYTFQGLTKFKTLIIYCSTLSYMNLNSVENVVFKTDSVASNMFQNKTGLKTVDLSEVSSVGFAAFAGCTNLENVIWGTKDKTLTDNAFAGCSSLTSVDLSNVTSIGSYAFQSATNLSSIQLGSKVTSIGQRAFRATAIEEIQIPKSVTVLMAEVFYEATSLKSIKYASTIEDWEKIDIRGALVSAAVDYYFDGAKIESYTPSGEKIPAGILAYSKSLTTVNLTGVKEIGNSAFANCANLENVTWSSNVEAIGSYAFDSCTKIPSVTLPEGLKSIGGYAFHANIFETVSIPKTVESIGAYAFLKGNGQNVKVLEIYTLTGYFGSGWYAGLQAEKMTVDVNADGGIMNDSTGFMKNVVDLTVTGEGDLTQYSLQNIKTLKKLTFESGVIGIALNYTCVGLTSLTDLYIKADNFKIWWNAFNCGSTTNDLQSEGFTLHCSSNFVAVNNDSFIGDETKSAAYVLNNANKQIHEW